MRNSPIIILTNILDIVNCQEDKQTFINQFSESCMIKGFTDIINSLTENNKLKLAEAISGSEEKELEKILYRFVSPEDYKKAIQNATSVLFEDLLKSIDPQLTPDQSNALDTYLASL